MPIVTVRDGARCVVRHVDGPTSLDELCPSLPPVPYASGWSIRPEGPGLVLVSPAGERHGTIAPGAALEIGDVTLALTEDRAGSTERLADDTRVALALVLNGRRWVLGTRTLTIGKGSQCDLVLSDPTVSMVHCKIIPMRDGWQVHDAGSTNGTRVGGVRVQTALLMPGTTLVLGRTRIQCVWASDQAHTSSDTREREVAPLLVGASPMMESVRQDIARYAPLRYPVLIQGETGSGKELVARMVHQQSHRARGPFVAINAAGIAPELVESELFGHERGAFTGAAVRRRGVFEEASGGTLFLDELGELPLAQQAKLLRVLETSEVRRVGAEGSVRVDVRIVCATHRDLAARAAEGHFRSDLLYRLDVLRVLLPPLRQRPEDLTALARHLMARISAETGRPKTLEDRAMGALLEHDWPGNVRELYAVLCRAAAAADGERVGFEHLHIQIKTDGGSMTRPNFGDNARGPGGGATETSVRTPRELYGPELSALVKECGGNISRVARATGLARSTLRDRLRRYDPKE